MAVGISVAVGGGAVLVAEGVAVPVGVTAIGTTLRGVVVAFEATMVGVAGIGEGGTAGVVVAVHSEPDNTLGVGVQVADGKAVNVATNGGRATGEGLGVGVDVCDCNAARWVGSIPGSVGVSVATNVDAGVNALLVGVGKIGAAVLVAS